MILTADYLVTGDGHTVIKNGAVHIENGKISEIGTAQEMKAVHPTEEVRVHSGSTLLPGMIDLHNHIGYIDGDPREQDFIHYPALRTLFSAKRMTDTLKAGVTTIRDVASADNIGVALAKAKEAGYLQAPRIFTSARGICMTGGHGAGLNGSCIEADGVDEVRKAVRLNVREGANCIKILTSEGYRGLEMSQEEINAAADEAHRRNMRIAAHAGYDPSMQMCIDAGCDTIEHGTHLTTAQCYQMRAHDQTWVPTIYVFDYCYGLLKEAGITNTDPNGVFAYLEDSNACYRDNFKRLYDTGVRVACGTDTDCCNHPQAAPVAIECAYMVRYGITPLQAIECATKNGAEALGMGNELGLIAPGYIADLIVVEGKPFEDISALEHVGAVYQNGSLLSL